MSKSLEIFLAKLSFNLETRADFYTHLAHSLNISEGKSIVEILERYATRYEKKALGIICRIWLERMVHSSSFSGALIGTIPDSEIAVLSTAEKSAKLSDGLLQLSENLHAQKTIRSDIYAVLGVALAMVIILHIYMGIQAFVVMPAFESAMKHLVDINSVKGLAGAAVSITRLIRDFWFLWVGFVIGLIWWVIWALPNYVGRYRSFLDKHIFVFQVYRDTAGSKLLMSASSLSAMIGSTLMQFSDALYKIREQTSEPWIIWHIDAIRENLKINPSNPSRKGEIFNTGIVSEELYFRLLDAADSSTISEVLSQISSIILSVSPKEIKKRSMRIRYFTLIICVGIMMLGYFSTLDLNTQFRALIQMKSM